MSSSPTQVRLFHATLLFLALVVCLLPCGRAEGQSPPDLRPEIGNVTIRVNQTVSDADVVEGCASASTGRTLLAFDHLAWNDGPGDISLGDPGCPDCDTTYVPVCTNPLFECSAAHGHNHAHLKNFSSYTVTKRGHSSVEVRGHKEGFCLVNSTCIPGVSPSPGGSCNQLAAGCADSYPSGLGCQYVDITRLRPGKYTLRVELNPLRTITEASYANNIQTYDFEVCKRTPSRVSLTLGPVSNGKRPFVVEGAMTFQSASILKDFNPLEDGLSPSLSFSDRIALPSYTNLPPGAPGSGCALNDGWRKTGVNKWEFRSDSEMDALCYSTVTFGVHSAVVEKKGKVLFVTLRGKLPLTGAPPIPTSATFSVTWLGASNVLNNQTCWTEAVTKKCAQVGPSKAAVLCK